MTRLSNTFDFKHAAHLGPDRSELDGVTLLRAQRGDEAACRRLVLYYQQGVLALIGRMLDPARRRTFVEDVAQETFLRVFRNLRRFSPEGPAPLSSWILTIAAHLAIDELRRRRPEQVTVDAPNALELPGGVLSDQGRQRREIAEAIQEALADLPPEFRAAFLLREYHGLPYKEIASSLRVDLGTVKSRLSRAKAILRATLAGLRDN